MSLEQALAANTAALEANTAALLKAGVAKPTPVADNKTTEVKKEATAAEKKAADAAAAKAKKDADAKAAAAAKSSEYTREGMVALLGEIKEKTGSVEAARAIITEVGGVEKMKDIAEDKIDAVYLAAKAKIDELDGGSAGSDDDGM